MEELTTGHPGWQRLGTMVVSIIWPVRIVLDNCINYLENSHVPGLEGEFALSVGDDQMPTILEFL